MNLLFDTHTFLWMSQGHRRLSATVLGLLSEPENQLFLSAASYWEIAIKISTGKLSTVLPLPDLVDHLLGATNLHLLPIAVAHAAFISDLPFHHRDPFDRMLIAQSLVEDLPILGRDTTFDQYGVNRIW